MFSKTIIDSDAFIDMPISARLLYYDLAMRADDDGFVNSPKKIIRMTRVSDEDLNTLKEKKFIIPFENGVVVIKHWKIHNYIRKDTYNETAYKEEKALLELDENKSYKLKVTTSRRSVDEPSTQDSIDKDSIAVKEITKTYEENIGMITPATADILFSYLNDFDDYKIIVEAIKKSALANKRNTSYINGILKSWKNKGYKQLADTYEELQVRTASNNINEIVAGLEWNE